MAVSVVGIVCIAFGVLVSIVAFTVLCFALYLHFIVHQKYKHMPGPPRQSFFLGNLPTISQYEKEGKLFVDAFTDWTAEYGPIIVIYFLHQAMILANSPEAAKEFLVSAKHLKSRLSSDVLRSVYGSRVMGSSLLPEIDHDVWIRKRAICDPAFHRKSLRCSLDHFNTCADLLVENLSKLANGKTEVALQPEINKITLEIIAKVAFGLELNLFTEKESKFNKAVFTLLYAMDVQYLKPWSKYSPAPSWRKFRQDAADASRLIREFGRECVQKRLQAKARGESLNNDLLTLMIEADERFEDFDGEVDWKHILDQFTTFFIAGQETTAGLLSFTFMELCRHPEIMHRLQTEIEAVIGDQEDLQFEDLSKLSYTSAILKETLRLYPPTVVASSREAACDTTLHGIRIPKGSEVMVVAYTMSRMQEYFEDPLVFNPDRFLGDQKIPRLAYIPFSTGPRSCIGQQFAVIEAKVLMVKLLKSLQFEMVPGQSFDHVVKGTLKLKDGCKVYIRPRDAEFGEAVSIDNKE